MESLRLHKAPTSSRLSLCFTRKCAGASVDILLSTVPGLGECCLVVRGLGEPLSMEGSREGSVRMGSAYFFPMRLCFLNRRWPDLFHDFLMGASANK